MMKNKVCAACGRLFSERKKWSSNWDEIKYCSKSCQSLKAPEVYIVEIMKLLRGRSQKSSICPSEVLPKNLKKVKGSMERVRSAGRLLAYGGQIEITQKGVVVEPSSFKGPVRFRLKK